MKKKFFVVLFAIIAALGLCFGLAACGAETSAPTPPDTQTDPGGTPQGGTDQTKEYTVTFDANGGAFSDGKYTKSATVKENEKLSAPEEPTRDKYTFVYWCTDSSLEVEWDFAEDTVTKTTTLYAKWESAIVEHDVTYVLNYEGAHDVVKPTEDGLVTYIPERDDYVFNGWWLSDGQTESGEYILAQKWDTTEKVTIDGLILVAEWVEKSTASSQLPAPSVTITADIFSWQEVPGAVSYDVRVYEPNSRVEKSKEIVQGTSWTFPSGYEAGYYTVKIRAMGDGETTVNSSYVSKSYAHLILGSISKIDFDISTSVLTWTAVKNATSYVLYIDSVEVETLTFTTYDLSEYEAGVHSVKIIAKRDGYQSSTVSKTINKLRLKTPNVTITPDEDLVNYTVSWESVSCADTYIVTIGGKETRVEGATSYTFDRTAESWGDIETIAVTVAAFDSGADYFRSNPSEEQTVKRGYLLTVIVSDEAAGSISVERAGYVPGDEVMLTATTNLGYTWVGWYKGDTVVSVELSYQIMIGKENVTYEARWTYYTLTTKVNNSSAGSLQQTYNNTKVTAGEQATLVAITNKGYTFVGWYKGEEEVTTEPSCQITMEKESVTYEARWEFVAGMEKFNFTSTPTTCTITGLKDTTATEIIIPGCVTSIGNGAFHGCGLTSITIPDSVTEIGYSAFDGCSGLTSIEIPDSVTEIGKNAFDGTAYYTDVANWDERGVLYIDNHLIKAKDTISGTYTIQTGTRTIANCAFSGCSGLTGELKIPDSVTSIGSYAFRDCSGLSSISVAAENAVYRSEQNCLIEKQSNTLILGCKKSVIPHGVTSIGNGAFYGCRLTGELKIPDSVTSIGEYAFDGCNGLTSITIPDSVTSIGEYAFDGCSELMSVTIGSGVTQIGSYAFYECKRLTGVLKIPDSVISIGSWAFYRCGELTSVTIGSGVTSIGSYAFSDCYGLTSVKIPDSVTSIGSSAFWSCHVLTSVEIPDSVTSIGDGAFGYCSRLTSVTIGSGVTQIGSSFRGCENLRYIYFKGTVKEWQAIKKSNYWDAETGNYTVRCTNGYVDKDGNVR